MCPAAQSYPGAAARNGLRGGSGDLPGTVAAVGHALTTERLVLRPVTAHDHAWLLAHWTAPEVRRFLFDGVNLSPAEITAVIVDSARGKGYATEAARAVVKHALGPLALPAVLAEVDEGNAASVAVADRLGMTSFQVVPGRFGPMIRYRRTR